LAPTLLKTLVAAGLMALAARAALVWMYQHVGTGTLLQELFIVISAGTVCIGVFALSAYVLRLEEFYRIFHLILRRKSQNHS